MLKSYAAKTDQGPCLEINEDDIYTDITNNLFLLFDGFGGAGVGDVAVSQMKDKISSFYSKIGGDPDSTMPFVFNSRYLLEMNSLINSSLMAHESLMKENEAKEMHQRGGSSMAGGVLCGNIFNVMSIGNTICCLIRDSKVQIVANPDCMTPPWMDTYQPQFHTAPLNALGLFTKLGYEVKEVRIKEGDCIIMMSDGVYARILPKDLREIVGNQKMKESEKVDKLFALANERGNRDNQSTIVLRF